MSPEKIKKLRKKLGMSQEEFALAIGLKSKHWVCRLENGKRDLSKTLEMAINSLK